MQSHHPCGLDPAQGHECFLTVTMSCCWWPGWLSVHEQGTWHLSLLAFCHSPARCPGCTEKDVPISKAGETSTSAKMGSRGESIWRPGALQGEEGREEPRPQQVRPLALWVGVLQRLHHGRGGEAGWRIHSPQAGKQERLERLGDQDKKPRMRKETEQRLGKAGAHSAPWSWTKPILTLLCWQETAKKLTHKLCYHPRLLTGPRNGWQPVTAISYFLRSSIWVPSSLGGSTSHRPYLTYWFFTADFTCGDKAKTTTQFTVENLWSYCHTKCRIFLGSLQVSCSSNECVAPPYTVVTAWGNHTVYLHNPLAP